MLDSIYHMTYNLFCNRIVGMKTLEFCYVRGVKIVIV